MLRGERYSGSGGTGSGWSVTYDCFLFSGNRHKGVESTNGFLIRIRMSNLLKPLYIQRCSVLIDSSFQSLHFPPSYFSSYSSTLNFVLSTLSDLGIPASDPHPLARHIFSFASRHYLSATTNLIPLYISFTSNTVLRNKDEAADWVAGGAPDSQVVKTLRITFESLKRLKDERQCLMKMSCGEEEEKCMICLEGFEKETPSKPSVSRLSCSHMFHFQCAAQWLYLDHRCPVCRSPMPWVHAFFPDHVDINHNTVSSNSSPNKYVDASHYLFCHLDFLQH